MRTFLFSILVVAASLMLSSALADAPQVEVAGVEALAEQDPCLRSPGGSGTAGSIT